MRDLTLPKTGEGAILGPTTTPNPGNVGLKDKITIMLTQPDWCFPVGGRKHNAGSYRHDYDEQT